MEIKHGNHQPETRLNLPDFGPCPPDVSDPPGSPALGPLGRPDVSSLSAERAATLAPLCSNSSMTCDWG